MIQSIAFVCTDFLLGGSEQVCYNTARYLAQRWGVKSYFFATRASTHALQLIQDAGGLYIQLPENNHSKRFLTLSNLSFLKEHIHALDLGLVILMAGWRQAADADEIASLPCKVTLWHHSIPLWECHEKLCRGRAKIEGKPWRWLEYQCLTRPKYEYLPYKRRAMMRSYKDQIAKCDLYLVLCPEYAEDLVGKLALPPQLARKIRPMINTQEIVANPQLEKQKEIIYMGRLDRGIKCVDRLLRVWQSVQHQLSDWTFKIYGSGDDEARLKKLALSLGLERCHLMGRIQYPREAYQTAAILCLSSNFEGFPMVLIEAQAQGVVPISFDISAGVRYIIGADERSGRLVPPYELEAYAHTLLNLCQDHELRERLQQACLTKVSDYAPDINDALWYEILEIDAPTPYKATISQSS